MATCVICVQSDVRKYNTPELLEAQCSVIFFLKEILNCNSPQLAWNLNDFLIKYGNPSDWIQFCGRCSKWVEEGKRLHKLIQQLQDKLQGIKLNFLESVQRTNGDNLDVDNSTENEVLLMVRTEILRKQEIRQEEEQKDKTDAVPGVMPDLEEVDLDVLGKVKIEMNLDEMDNYEDFVASNCDADGQFSNVIYPESTEDMVGGHEPSQSDEDYIPEKESSTKNKSEVGSNSVRQRKNNKRNGRKKTPAEDRTCPICSIVLDKPSLVQRHMKSVHSRIRMINCPECGRGFTRKESLATHSPICPNKRDDSHAPLKTNGRKKSPEEERTCPICFLVLDKPSLLQRHITSVHTRIPVINCPTCGKGFTRKDSLTRHTCPNIRKDISSKDLQTKVSKSNTRSYSMSPNSENAIKPHQLRQRTLKRTYKEDDSDTSLPASDFSSSPESDNAIDPKSKKKASSSGSLSWRKSPLEVRTCPVCAVVFDRPSFLAKHLRSNNFQQGNCSNGDDADVLQSIKCPVCFEILESKSSFSSHFQSHTKTEVKPEGNRPPVWCRKSDPSTRTCHQAECNGRVFVSPSKLKLHLVTKHKEIREDELLKCSYCPKTFAKKSYLKDHEWFHLQPDEKLSYLKSMRSKVPLKDKTCPVCNLVFLSISRMQFHLNSAHEKKHLWSCDVCTKGFTRKDSYEEHLKTHLSSEDKEKLMAGVQITVPSTQTPEKAVTLKLKVKKSGSISNRSCPTCGKVFSNRSKMSMHVKTVHEKSTATICEVCGKLIGCKQTFRMHMKFHEKEPGVKDWICTATDCDRAFRHRHSLRRHQYMTHNPKADLKKFPCPVPRCTKAYPFRSLLVQHQKASQHFSSGQVGDEDNSSSSSRSSPANNSIPEINSHSFSIYNHSSNFVPQPKV